MHDPSSKTFTTTGVCMESRIVHGSFYGMVTPFPSDHHGWWKWRCLHSWFKTTIIITTGGNRWSYVTHRLNFLRCRHFLFILHTSCRKGWRIHSGLIMGILSMRFCSTWHGDRSYVLCTRCCVRLNWELCIDWWSNRTYIVSNSEDRRLVWGVSESRVSLGTTMGCFPMITCSGDKSLDCNVASMRRLYPLGHLVAGRSNSPEWVLVGRKIENSPWEVWIPFFTML